MRSALVLSLLLLAAAPAAYAQSRGGRSGWRTDSRGPGWTLRARVGGTSRVQRGGVPSSRSTPRRSYNTPRRSSSRIGTYPSYPTQSSRRGSRQRSRRGNRSSGRSSVTIHSGRRGPRVTYSPRRRAPVCPTPTYRAPRVAVRTRVPGGSVTIQSGRSRYTGFEYRGPGVRYRQRWTAPPRVVYVDRPVVVEREVLVERPVVVERPVYVERVHSSPAPNASGAPTVGGPVIVRSRYGSGSAAPRAEGAPTPARPANANWRTTSPRRDLNAPRQAMPSTRPGVADRLLTRLEALDLKAACEVAAWAKDDPRREEILRRALFARFPSPILLRDSADRLREDPACRDHPGRPTLARLLATNSAPSPR